MKCLSFVRLGELAVIFCGLLIPAYTQPAWVRHGTLIAPRDLPVIPSPFPVVAGHSIDSPKLAASSLAAGSVSTIVCGPHPEGVFLGQAVPMQGQDCDENKSTESECGLFSVRTTGDIRLGHAQSRSTRGEFTDDSSAPNDYSADCYDRVSGVVWTSDDC